MLLPRFIKPLPVLVEKKQDRAAYISWVKKGKRRRRQVGEEAEYGLKVCPG